MAAAEGVPAPGDPRQVGGYTVLRRLGQGGMGVVYLASGPNSALVAVKVIHPAWADDEGFRRRFRREVAAARRVARFCTAPVVDADVDGPFAYLVTEYVEGPNLWQPVDQQGPLAGGNLEALAVGTAAALHAIHQAGVVHRDLKPSNVLLSPLGPAGDRLRHRTARRDDESDESYAHRHTRVHGTRTGTRSTDLTGLRHLRLGRPAGLRGHRAAGIRSRPGAAGALPHRA